MLASIQSDSRSHGGGISERSARRRTAVRVVINRISEAESALEPEAAHLHSGEHFRDGPYIGNLYSNDQGNFLREHGILLAKQEIAMPQPLVENSQSTTSLMPGMA
jgi:hypothetical protein